MKQVVFPVDDQLLSEVDGPLDAIAVLKDQGATRSHVVYALPAASLLTAGCVPDLDGISA